MSASKIVLKILSICISLLVIVLIIFGIFKIGVTSYEFGCRVFTEQPVDSERSAKELHVQITEGMSALSIGRLLEEKGLIRDSFLFVVQLQISDFRNSIKPGLYTLYTSQTTDEMMKIMSGQEEKKQE
ncbi:MAG: aminodeoxychorismate lyase [Lachnospiraceae bacterium]